MSTKTVYISIGNSDDKLTQAQWAEFYRDVDNAIRFGSSQAGRPIHHGAWTSLPTAAWQNACWCVVITPMLEERLRRVLPRIAAEYDQYSIAWAEAVTTFITPAPATEDTPASLAERMRQEEPISGRPLADCPDPLCRLPLHAGTHDYTPAETDPAQARIDELRHYDEIPDGEQMPSAVRFNAA